MPVLESIRKRFIKGSRSKVCAFLLVSTDQRNAN